MVLILESCSLEESCAALGQTTKVLFELRDRLRDWLKLQPHLPQDIPDQMLERIIFGVKMSLEQSKQKLDMFYTLKRHVPEILMDRDPRKPCFTELHKMIQIVVLPKLTKEKYTVTILRPISDVYRKFRASDSMKYLFMMVDLMVAQTHHLGNITIFDLAKANLSYVASHSPTLIKKCEVMGTEAYAIRVKGIHLINASDLTNQIITLAKSVLKPKISERIHVHLPDNYKSLHKIISKSILPKDYGGDEISMDKLSDEWREEINNSRDWFLEQDKIFADERLRPGAAIDTDNLFGTAGSFRKLDVD